MAVKWHDCGWPLITEHRRTLVEACLVFIFEQSSDHAVELFNRYWRRIRRITVAKACGDVSIKWFLSSRNSSLSSRNLHLWTCSQSHLTYKKALTRWQRCRTVDKLFSYSLSFVRYGWRRRRRRWWWNTEKGVGTFFTTASARVEVRLTLYTVQPLFFVSGFLWRFLLLFRSSATFRLYYSIQRTTTIPT